MVRPRKRCCVNFNPKVNYFKPRGIPLIKLKEVCLTIEEREAIRLADYENLTHEEACHYMKVSRPTFGRILRRARNAVAISLVEGKALKIEGGNYKKTDV